MARERVLKVIVAGDADKLERELKRANSGLDKLGKQTRLTSSISSKGFSAMRVGATGAAAGIAGLGIATKSVVEAAIEAEKSQVKMAAQLKASGISYQAHSKEIENAIQKTSKLAALDDEDLQDAFSRIVRTTGSVNLGLKGMAVAADVARGKGIELSAAGETVAKALAGNKRALKEVGVELGDNASRTEILSALQDKYAGQAKAYGETTAGSLERAQNNFENLKETIGLKLAPTIEKAADKLGTFVNEIQTGTGAGGRFADKLKDVWQQAKPIISGFVRAGKAVAKFTSEHPGLAKLAAGIIGVGLAVKGLRFVSAVTGFSTLLKGGRAAAKGLKSILGNAGTAAGGAAAENAAGSFTGRSGKIRSASKAAGRNLTSVMGSAGTTAGAAAADNAASNFTTRSKGFKNIGRKAGRLVGAGFVVGIIVGVASLADELTKKLEGLLKVPIPKNPIDAAIKGIKGAFGDGIGKAIKGGGSAGSLLGAQPALGPFAAVGARFGLSVSSGRRPGSITSSGNTSYHSSGEAVDLAGPAAGMLRTFKALKSSVGGRLAELIYTPGGTGIKDGRPHTYSGAVAANHNDHVHVALDTGSPGVGDGDGKVVGAFRRAISSTRAPTKAQLALWEAGIVESGLRNLDYGDRDSQGALQLRTGLHGEKLARDPYASAVAFLTRGFTGRGGAIALSRNQKLTAGQVAQAVQGSAYPARYDAVRGQASRYLGGKAAAGSSGGGGSSAGGGGSSSESSAPSASERAAKSGSRMVNKIASRFSPAISKATKRAASLGTAIEDAGTSYGQLERKQGQSDEDLGTKGGRDKRLSEISALKVEKGKQLAQQKKRAAALQRAISQATKQLKDLERSRKKAKGSKRAKMNERIRAFHDRLTDLKAELKAQGVAIQDTLLDIGDLDKDAADVAGTADTADTEREAGPSTTDKVSGVIGDIDARERAGLISAGQAQEERQRVRQEALNLQYGALTDRERYDLMGDMRDAQLAATEAQQAATQASSELAAATNGLRDEMSKSNAIATSSIGIQLQQAQRAFGDLLSRELGGRVATRATMPGTGQLSRL